MTMPRARKPAEDTPDLAQFETMLKELDTLVARMEQGEQSLEASLHDFERGVYLTRTCQALLTQAQQRVDILTQDGRLEPFEGMDDAD